MARQAFSQRVLRGSVLLSAAALLSRIATLVAAVVLVRWLGVEGLGQLAVLTTWVQTGVMLSTLGLGVAATRFAAEIRHAEGTQAAEMWGALIALSAVLPIVGGMAIAVLIARGGATEALSAYHIEALLWTVFLSLDKIGSGMLLGYDRYGDFVALNATVGLATVPVLLGALVLWRFDGAVVATVLLAGMQALGVMALCVGILKRERVRPTVRRFRANARSLFNIATPTVIGEMIANPIHTVAITLLARQPEGVMQVGLLNAAMRFVNLANFLPANIALTLIPALTSEWVTRKGDSFRNSLESSIRTLWFFALPIALFTCVASRSLLRLSFGTQFEAAWPILFLLMIQMLLTSINESNDRALVAANRAWLSTTNNLVHIALFVPLLVLLLPGRGGLGYATASVIAFAIYVAYQNVWTGRLFGVRWRACRPVAVWTVVFFLAAWMAQGISSTLVNCAVAILLPLVAATIEWRALITSAERARVRVGLAGAWSTRTRGAKAALVRESIPCD